MCTRDRRSAGRNTTMKKKIGGAEAKESGSSMRSNYRVRARERGYSWNREDECCNLWKNGRMTSEDDTPVFSVKLVLVSRERAHVSKQVHEKEPLHSSRLCVGDRSVCVA